MTKAEHDQAVADRAATLAEYQAETARYEAMSLHLERMLCLFKPADGHGPIDLPSVRGYAPNTAINLFDNINSTLYQLTSLGKRSQLTPDVIE